MQAMSRLVTNAYKRLKSFDELNNLTTWLLSIDRPAKAAALVFLPPDFPKDLYILIIIIVRICLTGLVSLFGLLTNVVNIIVFYRQGFLSDSSIVSLTALTLCDLFLCLFTLWLSILSGFLNFFPINDPTWNVRDFYFTTGYRPQTIVAHIICLLMAYVASERCVTVMFPFKVKKYFSAKRSVVAVSVIILVTILSCFTEYADLLPVWLEDDFNNSLLRYMSSGIITEEFRLNFYMIPNAVCLKSLSILIVIVCNSIMVWKVRLSAKFRKSAAKAKSVTPEASNVSGQEPTLRKEKNVNSKTTVAKSKQKGLKLMRMMVLICSTFIICYVPDVWNVFYNYIMYGEDTVEVEVITAAFIHLLQASNSSCNIFIFYKMSSRFKQELKMFLACKGK